MKQRWFLLLAKAVISAGLVAWLLRNVNVADIVKAVHGIRYEYLAVAFSLQFVGTLITSLRWQGLLSAQGLRVPLSYLFQSFVVSTFFKQFLPSTVGGDVIRIYDSWRAGAGKSVAVTVIGVDRLLGLLALAFLAVLALGFADELTGFIPMLSAWVVLITFALVSITWLIFYPPSTFLNTLEVVFNRLPNTARKTLLKITRAIATFKGRREALIKALILSLLLQLNVITFYYLLGLSMGFDIAYYNFLVIVPLAVFVMMIPVSINGIGIRESVFVLLFIPFGISNASAIAYAWIEFGLFMMYGLLGGILYVLRKEGLPSGHGTIGRGS